MLKAGILFCLLLYHQCMEWYLAWNKSLIFYMNDNIKQYFWSASIIPGTLVLYIFIFLINLYNKLVRFNNLLMWCPKLFSGLRTPCSLRKKKRLICSICRLSVVLILCGWFQTINVRSMGSHIPGYLKLVYELSWAHTSTGHSNSS